MRTTLALAALACIALSTGCGKQGSSPDDPKQTQRIDALEKKQAQLDEAVEAAKEAEATSRQVQDGLKKRIDDQAATLADQASRFAAIQDALKATTDRFAEAHDRDKDLLSRMEGFQKEISQLGDALAAAQKANGAPDPALANAQKSVERLEASIDALRKSLADAQQANAKSSAEIAALQKQVADQARQPNAPPPAPKATSKDIEVHHVERVEVIDGEVVVTVEGTVTNAALSLANVRVDVTVAFYRGRDRGGATVYKLKGPTDTQEYKNMQPGETRPLLSRIVVASTAQAPNMRDLIWTAEVEVSPSVR